MLTRTTVNAKRVLVNGRFSFVIFVCNELGDLDPDYPYEIIILVTLFISPLYVLYI